MRWEVCHQSAATIINCTSLFIGKRIMKMIFFFSVSSLVPWFLLLTTLLFLHVFWFSISRSTIMKNISFLDLGVLKSDNRLSSTQKEQEETFKLHFVPLDVNLLSLYWWAATTMLILRNMIDDLEKCYIQLCTVQG